MATNGTSEHCCINGDLLPPKTKRPAIINGGSNGVIVARNSVSSKMEGNTHVVFVYAPAFHIGRFLC